MNEPTNYDRLVEAAKGLVRALGSSREVYIGHKHHQYQANFEPDRDPVIALRQALAALDAQGEVDALREAKREAWDEGWTAFLFIHNDSRPNPYAPPTEPADAGGEE